MRRDALEAFGRADEVRALEEAAEAGAALRARFNGRIVGELTGLAGRELGAFMADFRRAHSPGRLARMGSGELRERVAAALGGGRPHGCRSASWSCAA